MSPEGQSYILIVDDEPGILRFMRVFLEGDGHDVVSAGSTDEALAKVEEQRQRGKRLGLYFLDVKMPTVGGEALYRQLLLENPQSKGLLMTASNEEGQKLRSEGLQLESGEKLEVLVLRKPFDPEEITELAAHWRDRGELPSRSSFRY